MILQIVQLHYHFIPAPPPPHPAQLPMGLDATHYVIMDGYKRCYRYCEPSCGYNFTSVKFGVCLLYKTKDMVEQATLDSLATSY